MTRNRNPKALCCALLLLCYHVTEVWANCNACGSECANACGTRMFRACCFNYNRKRSVNPPLGDHRKWGQEVDGDAADSSDTLQRTEAVLEEPDYVIVEDDMDLLGPPDDRSREGPYKGRTGTRRLPHKRTVLNRY